MKTIVLAGGLGTRLSEETMLRPKPMVEIGGKPILWHILKIYAARGISEFIIALGYKGDMVKDYFLNFHVFNNDITVDLSTGHNTIHDGNQTNWKVHLIDTGLHTQTGGRLKRLERWLDADETFMFTYGDGVADLDTSDLLRFHRSHGKLATVTIVRSPARFGRIRLDGDQVVDFFEKPDTGEGWINGGFFVLSRKAIDYIDGDNTVWERDPVQRLTQDNQMMGYKHFGFWSCMDTLKEKTTLEELWNAGKAPWRVW